MGMIRGGGGGGIIQEAEHGFIWIFRILTVLKIPASWKGGGSETHFTRFGDVQLK